MDYRNPNVPWLQTGYDPNKDQSADDRISAAIINAAVAVIIVLAAILLIGVFSRCTTPRAVEEHHHHHYEADTMAVRHQVDSQLTSWHEEMTQYFQQRLEEYSASWFSHEDQREIDSVNGIYQQRYDSLASHVAQMDSTFVKKTPVGDTRPWYQRLWDNFRIAFVCLLIVAVLWFTRRWWIRLFSDFRCLK